MAAKGNQAPVFHEDELDDDDDDDSEEDDFHYQLPHNHNPDDDVIDEEDDDVLEENEDEEDLNSVSSADPLTPAVAVAGSAVTVAVPPPPRTTATASSVSVSDLKRQRADGFSISAGHGEKKIQQQQPLDDSRRLFQRLWTDEDEIELLQGFLEYTMQRGTSQNHHHDTALFYDQIKSKLQVDFNKNQLVEKLRRLKKKYRNVVSRVNSGKDFNFKSPHDQATFDISRKIWSNLARVGGEDDEEDHNPSPNLGAAPHPNHNTHNPSPVINSGNQNQDGSVDVNVSSAEKKKSRKRSRRKIEEKRGAEMPMEDCKGLEKAQPAAGVSIPGMIEETVRSCLSPLFKELLNNALNGPCGIREIGGGGMGILSPIPLNFGSSSNSLGGEGGDDKWRKQQILELEVYAKRLELVQDQIKATLDELRSSENALRTGNSS